LKHLRAAAREAAPEDHLHAAAWAAAPEYLDSLDLEKLTGTKASTWRYWAMLDQGAKSGEERSGPASFKLGRRRVWKKAVVVQWLASMEAATI
jgi:prophage regulatory protein